MGFMEWIYSKIGSPNFDLWSALELDILWQWLPTDIQAWISVFLVVMFAVALLRVIRG